MDSALVILILMELILLSKIQDHLMNDFFQSKNVAKIFTIGLSPVFISKMSDILNENVYYFECTIYCFHMQKIYL